MAPTLPLSPTASVPQCSGAGAPQPSFAEIRRREIAAVLPADAVWSALTVFVAGAGFVCVVALSARLGVLLNLPVSWDSWFDSDTVRVLDDMTQSSSRLIRAALHPLFGLLTHIPHVLIERCTGLPTYLAVRVQLALLGAATLVSFSALLRRLGARPLDAMLFAALFASSGAFVFFAPVPDTFALGALTTVVALLALLRAGEGWRGDVLRAAGLVIAFSATATNAIGPAAWVLATRPRASICRVVAFGVGLLGISSVAQHAAFPDARWWFEPLLHLLAPAPPGQSHPGAGTLLTADLFPSRSLGGYGEVVRAIFAHATVMPTPHIVPRDAGVYFLPSALPVLSVQGAGAATASPLGGVALVGWLVMLGAGSWRAVRSPRGHGAWLVLGAASVQLALHLVVGRETVLYSLHFQPLLVALAALTCIEADGRWRVLVRCAAVLTAVAAAVHNGGTFVAAADAIRVPRAASATSPDVTLELGLVDPDGTRWLGVPEDAKIRRRTAERGVSTTAVQRSTRADTRLALRVRDDSISAPDPRRLLSLGPALLISDRWVVLLAPSTATFRVLPPGSALCGEPSARCAVALLGRTGTWDVHFVDSLVKPVWSAMGGIARSRPSAVRGGWTDPRPGLALATSSTAPTDVAEPLSTRPPP